MRYHKVRAIYSGAQLELLVDHPSDDVLLRTIPVVLVILDDCVSKDDFSAKEV